MRYDRLRYGESFKNMELEHIASQYSIEEKFTVIISDHGLELMVKNGNHSTVVFLTASESLMLLDILQEEAVRLREIADQQSPLPIRYVFKNQMV